jgi:hypothetical protein
MTDDPTRSRRAFLGGVGKVAAVAIGGGLVGRALRDAHAAPAPMHRDPSLDGVAPDGPPAPASCARHDDLPAEADLAVRDFLGPVAPGAVLGGWAVARVYGVFRGALPIVLAHADGRRAQIDLMAHPAAPDDASPPGIASTRAGQLYLVNSGRGTRTTPHDLERAIHALAAQLATRDGAGLGLTSFAERHRCHPGGVFVVV